MIQNCTTIEQSKKLVELGLSPDTSDMCYPREAFVLCYDEEPVCHGSGGIGLSLPAWSLSALLNVLPRMLHGNCIQIVASAALWHVGYYSEHVERGADLFEVIFNMVIWLLENKHIKTEKI